DHMTDLELIFTMLGERVTTEISQQEEPDSFDENKTVAKRGGRVAGIARKETEKELGHSVISSDNFLDINSSGAIATAETRDFNCLNHKKKSSGLFFMIYSIL
ncbi:MAG: hypothetical protein K6A43_09725, partial [Treponema sp.]|nr:hypothetical protein [Treponema sp.]